MNLLRAVHATKVLALVCALVMTAEMPAMAGDRQGLSEVETRVRHIRLHRKPHHAWRDWHHGHRKFGDRRRHRSVVSGFDDFSLFNRDLQDVKTRTRHVRMKHRLRHHAKRDWRRDHGVVVIGGGYGFSSYDGLSSYGGDDFPSVTPGIGTYAGGISAFRQEGNGIYFRQYGNSGYFGEDAIDAAPPLKRAKIIVVSPQPNDRVCSWEHGVCVIRP
ncbi:hypothetical protein ILFOPFJJ_00307 [Ensifer psoraleae]|uniref:hypothetical protein n=1 Tax=Sinorhizobium psoraleae TaxID=520838 RepID=UPI0015696C33|nr:hypothetical protein [Sinorhizobium psoraleae]NRP69441.1 hypothetical protein [Sinorhizobium psoraleae]